MKLMTEAIFPTEFHNGNLSWMEQWQVGKVNFNQQIIMNHLLQLTEQTTHKLHYHSNTIHNDENASLCFIYSWPIG